MNAQLKIENIGAFRETKDFKFYKGKINYLELPNASGKSSIIKSISAVLSLPVKGEFVALEADKLGIKTFQGTEEPLVNIHEEEANIQIKYDDFERICKIRRDGKLKFSGNIDGEEEFLLAGVMTRESRFFRQLIEGNSDVQWIVDVLSLAEKYKTCKEIVQNLYDSHSLEFDDIKQTHNSLLELNKTEQLLKKELSEIKKEEKGILSKVPDIPKDISNELNRLTPEIEKETKDLETLEHDKKIAEEELSKFANVKDELEVAQKKADELKKQSDEIVKEEKNISNELKEWPKLVEELEKKNRLKIKSIDEKMGNFREEKGKKLGLTDLYESSQEILEGIEKGEKIVTCPLCKQGKIDRNTIEAEKKKLDMEVRLINEEIAKLVKIKDEYYSEEEKLMREKERKEREQKDLNQKIKEISKEYEEAIKHLRTIQREIDENKYQSAQKKIDAREKLISERKAKIKKLEEELKDIKERIEKLGSMKEEAKEKLGILKERGEQLEEKIRKTNEEIQDLIKPLSQKLKEYGLTQNDDFIKIYDQWLKTLNNVINKLEILINEQREGVRSKFNDEVKRILDHLDFKFDFYITGDFKIEVKSGGGKRHISSLSESEKAGVSLILLVILNKVYLTTPFLVIDELILGFDESRKKAVLDYLDNVANEKYVIVAKLPS